MSCVVPAGTFQVHSIAEGTILRLLSDLGVGDLVINLKLIAQLINGNDVLASIVLKSSSQESLREEEAGNPVSGRHATFNPALEEFNTLEEFAHPGS